jgi:hypothetical protein
MTFRYEPNWQAYLCLNGDCKFCTSDFMSAKAHDEVLCEFRKKTQRTIQAVVIGLIDFIQNQKIAKVI